MITGIGLYALSRKSCETPTFPLVRGHNVHEILEITLIRCNATYLVLFSARYMNKCPTTNLPGINMIPS